MFLYIYLEVFSTFEDIEWKRIDVFTSNEGIILKKMLGLSKSTNYFEIANIPLDISVEYIFSSTRCYNVLRGRSTHYSLVLGATYSDCVRSTSCLFSINS